MLNNIVRILGGDPHRRQIQKLSVSIDAINALEAPFEKLSNEELRAKTDEFRARLAKAEAQGQKRQDALNAILVEAFAVVREASKRTLGKRPYDVQMIGGMVLHQGKIAEMRTGEGKTLVATLPLYLNGLTGKGAHLVTVNDYLARRDARWMAPIFVSLGLSVGVLQMAARTENGQKAFVVDLEKRSPHEDQDQLRLVDRAEAYATDITYGTNSEFGFDYLRDNLTLSLQERVQRGHHFAIVDEVDNILIDEARTPLIISGPASEDLEWYTRMALIVRPLQAPEDVEVDEKDRTVVLTELGEARVEEMLGQPLHDVERPEDMTPEQARILGYLEQALRAQFLYRRNKDYLVQSGKVVIVDEFTGRLMPGRRWSEGLHQAVEAKEGVRVEPENITYATITLQNYFRMYERLCGMTGTAETEAEELSKIYKLDVQPIPTNLEYVASKNDSALVEIKRRDADGYEEKFYGARGDSTKSPVYWRRKDYPDVVFRTEEGKLRAITQEILRMHVLGRPQLVGTTSVEHSERLSLRLDAELLRRLMQTLLIRQAYIEKNKIEYVERAIPELASLALHLGDVEPSDIRKLARSLDISLSLEEDSNLAKLVEILQLRPEDKARLAAVLQSGIPHQVLNARKHDEESQIIARAGGFGGVTIATNMAGRGVDIKLGGDLPEEILQDVVRVLGRAGYTDPYDMSNEDRRQALRKLTVEDYGIYEESVQGFFKYLDDMQRVRELGGLHVVGSERHEARRIDNQLRGRAARQGDPGSSRFYLSLEDDLMRLFGGQQVESLFKRLNIDENLPIEHNLVGRMVEQSQQRVEGNNFDVRKHLLEYDDVLNSQRKRIYSQRDRVFTKEDLTEDVEEMLSIELEQRIPKALQDEGGPWKLLAYLEEIQPTIEFDAVLYPSYTYRLLLNELQRNIPASGEVVSRVRAGLLSLAGQALNDERKHIVKTIGTMLDNSEEAYAGQVKDRLDSLDTFLEGLRDDEEAQKQRPQDLLTHLAEQTHVSLKLNPDQLRRLAQGDSDLIPVLSAQVKAGLMGLSLTRLIVAIERRLEEDSGLHAAALQELDWKEAGNQILNRVEDVLDIRFERLLGKDGQITHDLDPVLDKLQESALDERNLLQFLRLMSQGTRVSFDRRTHRQGRTRYTRLNYVYLAAGLMETSNEKETTQKVLDHLRNAEQSLQLIWGQIEFSRLSQNNARFDQLDESLRAQFTQECGEEHYAAIASLPFLELPENDQQIAYEVLGKRVRNEIYRQLLLRTISERWIDYLTQVEALRVAIGLEAYAQRDPLVTYKARASELFQTLLADIRISVIGRMFTYQPSRMAATALDQSEAEVITEAQTPTANEPAPEQSAKKKRHRH